MNDTPRVAVVIAARDAAPTLARTLACLRAQDLGQPFEVTVVDDGSRDETATLARQHEPFVRLIRNDHSQGPGSARNAGARASRAPVLAFTDADCFPRPNWLASGLRHIANAPLVQGRVDPDPQCRRMPFDRSLSVSSDGGFYQTANLFVRRQLFDAVGGFWDWALERPGRRRWSVDYRRGRAMRTPIGEDTVFAWKARRLGALSAFADDAVVYHAVVPGTLRHALADRWHWTRDMPGLARLVPELRDGTFWRRWFFSSRTARFDLALVGLSASALTRQRLLLAGALPYLRDVRHEAMLYWRGRDAPLSSLQQMATFVLGAPAVDGATLVGLIAGSVAWRSLVL
jgi:glycosyltransferase involved in cell wall biosynthesis